MDVFFGIMFLLAIPAGLTLIGFAIVLLVGFINKSNKVKQVGRIGSIISGSIFGGFVIILIGSGLYLNHQEKVQAAEEKRANKQFNKRAADFKLKYILAASTAEDVGNNESSAWGDGIDNSDGDFDVDSTVNSAVDDNSDDITSLSTSINAIKNDLTFMEANDTGKYDLDKYKKAYNKLNKLINLVSSPYGSFSTFNSNFSELDTDTSSAYQDLNE